MAKARSPLHSTGASGKLGKDLVYFPWKGLNVVRSYTTPANPRSAAQTKQRNLFKTLAQLGKTGIGSPEAYGFIQRWNGWRTRGRPLSEYNLFIKDNVEIFRPYIDEDDPVHNHKELLIVAVGSLPGVTITEFKYRPSDGKVSLTWDTTIPPGGNADDCIVGVIWDTANDVFYEITGDKDIGGGVMVIGQRSDGSGTGTTKSGLSADDVMLEADILIDEYRRREASANAKSIRKGEVSTSVSKQAIEWT